MILDFDQNITAFIKACNSADVKLMVVGGAEVKSARSKYLLDIQELKRIHKLKD